MARRRVPKLLVHGLLFLSAANPIGANAAQLLPLSTEGSPENHRTAEAVCGACHTTRIFSGTPRSWARWTDIFSRMTRHGMQADQDQIDRVVIYFLENLTLVNVNSSSADELAVVLGVSESVSAAIVARRGQRKFSGMSELTTFPGVDVALLKRRSKRIQF